jgi:hypothetical protein
MGDLDMAAIGTGVERMLGRSKANGNSSVH